MPPMIMDTSVDAKAEIMENMGNLEEIEVFNNQVLIAIYIRPTKTKSGIILTDRTVDEDRWQGKVGLVVKIGASAFEDSTGQWFNGVKINVGDWVVFRPSDGWHCAVNGNLCRLLDDVNIRARIQHPDQVW